MGACAPRLQVYPIVKGWHGFDPYKQVECTRRAYEHARICFMHLDMPAHICICLRRERHTQHVQTHRFDSIAQLAILSLHPDAQTFNWRVLCVRVCTTWLRV